LIENNESAHDQLFRLIDALNFIIFPKLLLLAAATTLCAA
jgi:hypothetical protein